MCYVMNIMCEWWLPGDVLQHSQTTSTSQAKIFPYLHPGTSRTAGLQEPVESLKHLRDPAQSALLVQLLEIDK